MSGRKDKLMENAEQVLRELQQTSQMAITAEEMFEAVTRNPKIGQPAQGTRAIYDQAEADKFLCWMVQRGKEEEK
jgi:hypothetical protein